MEERSAPDTNASGNNILDKIRAQSEHEEQIIEATFYKDPVKMGWTAITFALISMVILRMLSIFAILSGIVGLYFSFKNKAGAKAIALNSLAIVLGLASQILYGIVK